MQLQIIPMPIYYPINGYYGPTRPNTEQENLVIISVISAIYVMWIISFLITYFLYKRALKKKDNYAYRDWQYGYLNFRFYELMGVLDTVMVLGIIAFVIYKVIS